MDKAEHEVLLIEDGPADVLMLREALAQDAQTDFRLTVVERLADALATLAARPFAAVLLDLGLPDSQGLPTFRHLLQAAPLLPVVVLCAREDEEVARLALQAGAQDYLVKRPEEFAWAGRTVRQAIARQRGQTALRENEARFHGVLESMQEGVLLVGWDWRYLYINKSAEAQGRRPAEELLGRVVTECWPGIETTAFFQQEKRVMQERQPAQIEGSFDFPDGETRWFHWNIQPAPEGLLIVTRDITERKQAEQTLRETEERLEMVMEGSQLGYWDWNIETGEVHRNARWGEMLGYTSDEVRATVRQWSDLHHPDDRDAAMRSIQDHLEGKTPAHRIEYRMRTKDGRYKWVLDQAKIVQRGPQGAPLRMSGTHTDITERKHAEEKLQHTLEELRRSNAELEQFAYVASHDLQEPLRTVAGMVQLLQRRYRGQLDERADEYIQYAVDASERMQRLIHDLLELSRVGRKGRPFAATAMEQALAAALTNLRTAIAESGAEITSGPLPVVQADAGQMTQVLQNLLGNAIKFRGERPPQIHLSAEQTANSWQFAVQDNGIGIEPQYFERVFQLFQRLHTRGQYPGTGIGLALCRKIIDRHGGKMWVQSGPGQGATFFFSIPDRPGP